MKLLRVLQSSHFFQSVIHRRYINWSNLQHALQPSLCRQNKQTDGHTNKQSDTELSHLTLKRVHWPLYNAKLTLPSTLWPKQQSCRCLWLSMWTNHAQIHAAFTSNYSTAEVQYAILVYITTKLNNLSSKIQNQNTPQNRVSTCMMTQKLYTMSENGVRLQGAKNNQERPHISKTSEEHEIIQWNRNQIYIFTLLTHWSHKLQKMLTVEMVLPQIWAT